ncbi:MAG TPA: cold shock domain-containing protein [Acidimicrobiales bacterium]|nr:cold shock domain-containing protein [Acidimicrobiales bacterium]
MAALGSGSGVVKEFDERRGLGTIAGDDGNVLPFHCTAIADGSRTVDEGRRVRFDVAPGLSGRWEAAGIEKL